MKGQWEATYDVEDRPLDGYIREEHEHVAPRTWSCVGMRMLPCSFGAMGGRQGSMGLVAVRMREDEEQAEIRRHCGYCRGSVVVQRRETLLAQALDLVG